MKKLLIASNLLFIAIAIFLGCKARRPNGSYSLKKLPAYSSCYNCVVDDIHGETVKEFAQAVSRYKNTNWQASMAYAKGNGASNNLNPMNTSFVDARSCWYPIDTLKKFICLLEKYSSDIKLSSKELGIRFYYATYPGHSKDLWNGDFAGCHTLYLTSTYSNGVENIDFDARISANAHAIVRLDSLMNNRNLGLSLLMLGSGSPVAKITTQGDGSERASMNQSDLCPPNSLFDADGNSTMYKINQIYPGIGY